MIFVVLAMSFTLCPGPTAANRAQQLRGIVSTIDTSSAPPPHVLKGNSPGQTTWHINPSLSGSIPLPIKGMDREKPIEPGAPDDRRSRPGNPDQYMSKMKCLEGCEAMAQPGNNILANPERTHQGFSVDHNGRESPPPSGKPMSWACKCCFDGTENYCCKLGVASKPPPESCTFSGTHPLTKAAAPRVYKHIVEPTDDQKTAKSWYLEQIG